MTCSLCSREIPEDRLRKHSKFCSRECQEVYRRLYMRFRKIKAAEWKEWLAPYLKTQDESRNSVTEVV